MINSFAFFSNRTKKNHSNSPTEAGNDIWPDGSTPRRRRKLSVHDYTFQPCGRDSLDHRRATAADERLGTDSEQRGRLDHHVQHLNYRRLE